MDHLPDLWQGGGRQQRTLEGTKGGFVFSRAVWGMVDCEYEQKWHIPVLSSHGHIQQV
jgi:hypothetical protein